jgi:transcriptional regulator with XRE-family HTH domain
MRESKLEHVLAILRKTIGKEMTQKELARILNRAPVTIQKIELGERPLVASLAEEISQQTGVSLEWLMKNDVSESIVDQRGAPYTKQSFEDFQSLAYTRTHPGLSSIESIHVRTTNRKRLDALILRAYKDNRMPMLAFKLATAFSELEQRFGVNDTDRNALKYPAEWPKEIAKKIEKDPCYLTGYESQPYYEAMKSERQRKEKVPLDTMISGEYEWIPDGQIKYYPERLLNKGSKETQPKRPQKSSPSSRPAPRRQAKH